MVSEFELVIGILLGGIAFICLYFGKGLQKYAIVGFTKEGATKGEKGKHSGIWMVGLIFTGSFMFIHLFALGLTESIAVIAPLEGIGLIILCLFSYFVLKEPIDRMKSLGIGLILVGLVLTSVFMPSPEDRPDFYDQTLFIIFLCVIMGIFLILGLISKLNKYHAAGIIFGTFAGAFMCFQTLTKRITWISEYGFYFFIMLLFAGATLLMTNFAFLKADAVIVVPSFTAMSIMLPTILAIFLFNEPVIFLQWVGICIIVVGIVFLTAFSKEEPPPTKTQSADE